MAINSCKPFRPQPKPYINPYLAGVLLGVLLTLAFVVSGRGLGASGAVAQIMAAVAPESWDAGGYLAWIRSEKPLWQNWIVLEVLGILLGAYLSARLSGRYSSAIIGGDNSSQQRRLGLALMGGILMGFAARLARGCTSGQALTGGALLNSGSWYFMVAVFIGGYVACIWLKKEWR